MKVIYLATPYSGTKKQQEERFKAVSLFAGELINKGNIVYSPISHSHPIAKMKDLPKDWKYWEKVDSYWISCCDEIYIYCLDGWKESTGVQAEIEIAKSMNKQIIYIEDN
jgi:hypothetical protein